MHVLMVTIGYPPLQVGGTEIYVQGLVEALKEKGVRSSVVYVEAFADDDGPDFELRQCADDGTTIYSIGVNTTRHKLEFTMFDERLRRLLLREFHSLIEQLDPDLIHVHPLQLGIESYLIEDLNRAGRKVVLTYHSTTTTCARGDLIYMGRSVCDGLVTQARCTQCLYHWKTVPESIAVGIAHLPTSWLRPLHSRLGPPWTKLRSFISIPLTIEERRNAWRRSTENASKIVAVCNWVRETIIKNDVSADKVVFSRHGVRPGSSPPSSNRRGTARFGYLGRISPEKGIDLLVDTLTALSPELDFEFEFCSSSFKLVVQPDDLKLVAEIRALAQKDRRIKILDNVQDEDLRSVLANWDAMVVPSRWLESGPQVVYESFAVQTPIIGSRLGGIAELVSDGETGLLFEAGNRTALTNILIECANTPTRLRELRANIQPVRTTQEVADDMFALYTSLIGSNDFRQERVS